MVRVVRVPVEDQGAPRLDLEVLDQSTDGSRCIPVGLDGISQQLTRLLEVTRELDGVQGHELLERERVGHGHGTRGVPLAEHALPGGADEDGGRGGGGRGERGSGGVKGGGGGTYAATNDHAWRRSQRSDSSHGIGLFIVRAYVCMDVEREVSLNSCM